MGTNEPTKSNVHLAVEFHATGDTPRLSAAQIASLVKDFLAAQLDLAGTEVAVTSAFLNYRVPHAHERYARDEYPTDAEIVDGLSEVLDKVDPQRVRAFGNPAKDQSN